MKVSEFRLPRNAAFRVAGMPSKSLMAESRRPLSVELIPGVEPLATVGKPKDGSGGLRLALSEIDGTSDWLAQGPPPLVCFLKRTVPANLELRVAPIQGR